MPFNARLWYKLAQKDILIFCGLLFCWSNVGAIKIVILSVGKVFWIWMDSPDDKHCLGFYLKALMLYRPNMPATQ